MNQALQKSQEDKVSKKTPRYSPHYEVEPYEDGYVLTVFMPGVGKDGLTLSLNRNILSIEGVRTHQSSLNGRCIRCECGGHDYTLELDLDVAIEPDKVEATMSDGLLRLRLPVHKAVQSHTIPLS